MHLLELPSPGNNIQVANNILNYMYISSLCNTFFFTFFYVVTYVVFDDDNDSVIRCTR